MTETSSASRATSPLTQVAVHETYAVDVTRKLRLAILNGTFGEGDKLSLAKLAEQLGVSVMPVREALVALANEGLVANEPNRSFRATPLGPQDVDDVYALHAHISGILAGRAAESATDEDIAELRALYADFRDAAVQPESAVDGRLEQLNDAFHRKINSIGQGRRLRWFLRLTTRLIPSDQYERVEAWCSATLDYHPRIIDAMARHDAEATAALMRQHLAEGPTLSRGAPQPGAGTDEVPPSHR